MAGGKLSPRQKMIGMMYLVLTALLAMNVSKDILNAFVTVNDGLEKTKTNFGDKNQDQYAAFAASYNENKAKVEPFYNKAIEVQKLADEIVTYIDDIKVEIIAGIEPSVPKDKIRGKNEFGKDTILNLSHVKVKDNYLFSTNLLVGSEPSKPKDGEFTALSVKSKLENFRDNLLQKVPAESAIASSLTETFKFQDKKVSSGVTENWPSYNFYGVPAAATLTLLTKLQTDVRNAESDVIKYLYASVDAASFKFNVLESAVIPNSNYVLLGDTFYAEVFLAAFDSTQNPRIVLAEKYDSTTQTVSGDSIPVIMKDGKGYVKIPAKSQGDFTYNGIIKFKTPSGEINNYPFKTTYQVAKPSTTISATKMNLFYIGVPNPVDISAPGVGKDKIRASISNGSISKSSEGWEVNVKTPGTVTINVNAEVDGSNKSMGKMEFRVKKIPTPVAEIGGINSGSIPKNKLASTAGIVAQMDNFEFDIRVVVASYKFVYTQANGLAREVPVNGPRFDDTVKKVLQGLAAGSRVTFEDIKVRMPDGEMRTLSPVVLKAI
tara:strand:- start:7997 stop:9637 length:1641 start_codon:yes stop_codon:yes gene_type:complete